MFDDKNICSLRCDSLFQLGLGRKGNFFSKRRGRLKRKNIKHWRNTITRAQQNDGLGKDHRVHSLGHSQNHLDILEPISQRG